MKKFILLYFLLAISHYTVMAQSTDVQGHDRTLSAVVQGSAVGRPVSSTVEVQLGTASVRNTYLAPLLYSGPDLGIGYERTRRWKNLSWMSLQSLVGLFTMGQDQGGHSDSWSGRLRYRYAALYRFDCSRFTVAAGPYAGVDVGFDYNLKMGSSNNPATAHVTSNLGLQLLGMVPYRLLQRQGVASLQLHAPLLGYAIMPEYGASYYESFYLGNTDGLHHFTSLHNQQDLGLRLTTDLSVSPRRGGAVRLGVGYRIETMRINQVTTRFSSFEAIIGWTFQCLPTKFTPNGLSYEVY